jgi:signal transduction histidine kinase
LGSRGFTTKASEGGAGIGLSVARRIVERHGGDIAFENRATGGARVTLRLPCPAR